MMFTKKLYACTTFEGAAPLRKPRILKKLQCCNMFFAQFKSWFSSYCTNDMHTEGLTYRENVI